MQSVANPSNRPPAHHLPEVLWTALHHGRQTWRALREGDQEVMISTLLDLARTTGHPDAYFVDGRPAAPRVLVVYSAAGLQAVADTPALDKGPTANIAIGASGDPGAYEAIMGPARGRPYGRHIALLDAVIKRSQRGLRRTLEIRAREHLEPPRSFDLRQAQHFTASVILDHLFPAHRWTRDAIVETIEAFETNAQRLGPAIQNSALRGDPPEAVLAAGGVAEVVARYERVIGDLAREEQESRAARASSPGPQPEGAEDDSDQLLGLCTQLAREGLSWSDTKALVASFFAASYETVSTTLTEWVYQVTRYPGLWEAMQQAAGDERRQKISASVYESVRIITPLPILLRRAEEDCVLEIPADGRGPRAIALRRGEMVIGLNVAPLRDPLLFPDPGRMRLKLTPEQRARARLAWGLEPSEAAGVPDRFCRGFSYSIALMTATIEHLLERCHRPQIVADCPIQMFGTQSRRGFEARLLPRA